MSAPRSHNELWAQARQRAFYAGAITGVIVGLILGSLIALKFDEAAMRSAAREVGDMKIVAGIGMPVCDMTHGTAWTCRDTATGKVHFNGVYLDSNSVCALNLGDTDNVGRIVRNSGKSCVVRKHR